MQTMKFEVQLSGKYRTTEGDTRQLVAGDVVWASSLEVQVRCFPDTIAIRYLGRDVLVPEHLLKELK